MLAYTKKYLYICNKKKRLFDRIRWNSIKISKFVFPCEEMIRCGNPHLFCCMKKLLDLQEISLNAHLYFYSFNLFRKYLAH